MRLSSSERSQHLTQGEKAHVDLGVWNDIAVILRARKVAQKSLRQYPLAARVLFDEVERQERM